MAAFAVVGALGLVTASASLGAGDIKGLRQAACPPSLKPLPSVSYPKAAVTDARRRNLFKVGPYTTKLVPPVNWRKDAHHSQRFRNALASFNWVDVLLFDYRVRRHRGALRQARNLMLDWIDREARGETARETWHSKVVGDRAGYLGYLTRAAACEKMLRREQARTLLRSLELHASWLVHHRAKNNHGLFDNIGLLALGRDLRFMDGDARWRRLGRRRFVDLFLSRVKEHEGLWLENSAGYHYLLTNLLARFVPAAGGHRARLRNLLQRMEDVGGWLIEPDDRIVQSGDSNLLSPGDRSQRQADSSRGMLVLAKSGLAVVKQPGSFLSVDAGFHERAHKHSDELSFDLFDRGHRVVSDTGMYQKDPGKIRNFVRSARAHSTLTVDRRDFPRSARYAYGSGLKAAGTGAGWYAIQARNPLLRRQAVLHTRLFLYKPGVALIVVDRVRSPNKHSYDRYFQLGPHVDIQPEDPNELRLEAAGLHASLYSESSVGRERRSNVRGSRKPLAGWTSPSYRDLTPRWTVDLRSAAADADYVTTIGLDSSRLHATLGSVGLSRTSLNLASYAVPEGTLTVRRDGSRLTVTQAGA